MGIIIGKRLQERLWKDIVRQIEMMSIPESSREAPGREEPSKEPASDGSSKGKAILALASVATVLWSIFSKDHGLLLLPAAATVREMTMKRDDPLFPSKSILSGAGLRLSEQGELDLPGESFVRTAQEKAFQLLIGVRCGRNVRSGLHTTPEGHTVVRTGISCSLPAFCCEVRGGELLTMDAPASLVQAVASRRTGSDRLTVTNDGQWLVISRIIREGRSSSRTWLLLRQLRDISLAEFIIGGY